jgi:L-arabinose isomerase
MEKLRVGFLPISMKLLNDNRPEIRTELESFAKTILSELKGAGLEIVEAQLSCISEEFEKAVRLFIEKSVDAIITLHLTYSPSLESAIILSKVKIPLIIFNSTPSFSLGPDQNPDDITYNHGIHGVQDFCNILIRNDKKFFIESGHWKESDVVYRIKKRVIQAAMAKRFLSSRTGLIGKPFTGMGDFQMPFDLIEDNMGVKIIKCDVPDIFEIYKYINETEIDTEVDIDRSRFVFSKNLDIELYRDSLKTGLALRKWIEKNNLSAFTMNALSFNFSSKLPVIPFLESSKQMTNGKGYAGEGDVLTATLLSSIIGVFPESVFTENFCPDWKRDSIFLNHIGEGNFKIIKDKPLLVSKNYAISDSKDIVVLMGTYKPGNALLISLAPGYENKMRLIIANGEMLETETADNMNNTIHGWFKPEIPLEDFLTNYSLIGGTHHCVLVYSDNSQDIEQFGHMMGWEINKIC